VTAGSNLTISNASASEQRLLDSYRRAQDLGFFDSKKAAGQESGSSQPYSIDKAGGAIRLDRLPRGGRLTTGGGDIKVGETGGNTLVSTGGGNITLGPVRGMVEAFTGAGDVEITVPSTGGEAVDISVTTGKGRVIINLPADASVVLDLDAAYTRSAKNPAKIDSDFTLTRTAPDEWDSSVGSPRRHVRGTGTIGSGAGRIRVRTVNGDIIIRRT
jgi:hypothetical protein